MLSSIEKVAIQLDEHRKTRVKSTPVDFEAYMAAREADTALIRPATDFRNELEQEFFGDTARMGGYLPWRKVDEQWRIRKGELTVWTGFNGHMKSMVTGYVMLDLIKQGEKVCVASFEMKPTKTLKRMASQAVGTANPSLEYIDKFLDMVSGNLWLYDQQGDTTPERVIAVITYCAEQLKVTQFVVDSLMKVIGDEDDYNAQKKFVGRLHNLSRELGIHIHLVTHARKKDDEAKRPGKQDNKGSGSIVDQTDNFVSVFKIPKKPDDTGPDFCLYVDKQRHGEWEGNIALWFDDKSLQFKETSLERARHYV